MQWRSYKLFDWCDGDMRHQEANSYTLLLVSHSLFPNRLTHRRDGRVLFLDDDYVVDVAKSVSSGTWNSRHHMYTLDVFQELSKRNYVYNEAVEWPM
jgi:hypothetical protein